MSKINQHILLSQNNSAFDKLLQNKPELINSYVDKLIRVNGGSYSESIDKKEVLRIIQSENIIGNTIEIIALLKTGFIGIN